LPDHQKPMIDIERMRMKDAAGVRDYLEDGNFGGLYQRSDEDMLAIWKVAVEETRALIEGPWS
jgi:creatinine amidohydrolase